MSESDLFSLLRQTAPATLTAPQQFVNRTDELEALRAHAQAVAGYERTALPKPGGNLFVLSGASGLGKSALSRRHLADVEFSLHVDLRDPRFADSDALLLALRHSLLDKRQRAIAFDTAFFLYWTQTYPGINIGTAQTGNALVDVGAAQVASTFDALAGIPVAGVSVAVLRMTARKILDHGSMRNAIRCAPQLKELLERGDAIELRHFLPFCLQVDLHNASASPRVVVLDHWERVEQIRVRSPHVVDSLLRVVVSLAGVQFVLTSRANPQWLTCSEPDLIMSGPALWSGSMQRGIELHRLSATHEAELVKRTTNSSDYPTVIKALEALPPAERGSPLLTILAATAPSGPWGKDPYAAFVDHITRTSFPREAAVLRLAAAAGSFNFELLRAAEPTLTASEFVDFTRVPFVDETGGVFPWRLHDRIAAELLRTDRGQADVQRALRALRYLETSIPTSHADVRASIEIFVVGWRLTTLGTGIPAWLFQLAYRHRLLMIDGVLALPVAELTDTCTDARRAFALCCLGMERRAREDYQGSAEVLMEALQLEEHPVVKAFIAHRLAKPLQVLGRYDEALANLDLAARTGGADQELAEKDAAFLALFLGDVDRAVRWIERLPLNAPIERRAQAHDLAGWVCLVRGDIERAVESFEWVFANEELETAGVFRDSSSRHRALALAFIGDERSVGAILEAREVNNRLHKEVGLAQCDLAEVLSHADGDRATVDRLISSAQGMLASRDNEFDGYLVDVVAIWASLINGWPDLTQRHLEALRERVMRNGMSRSWLEVAEKWISGDPGGSWPSLLNRRRIQRS